MIRALDLFAGAGGATAGLMQAGLNVTAIDNKPQPHNPANRFIRGDVFDLSLAFLRQFSFIWASPPCQAHTALKHAHNAKPHIDVIESARRMLVASGVDYCIENVINAPLVNPITLCGSMFNCATPDGAQLRRHRLVETSFPILAPPCRHRPGPVLGCYGGHLRRRTRPSGTNHVPLSDFSIADGQAAMGIDWMTLAEMSEAIPPAYSRYTAEQWLGQKFAAHQDGEHARHGQAGAATAAIAVKDADL